ncbi:MAG TPA: hypothetical protein VJV39_27450 [Dongiaceae bacterium]|nr:hypothetical protein [Dongiaceae bacterium]
MAEDSEDEEQGRSPTPITELVAAKYVGKYILVGITREDAFGKEIDRFQIHGVIESVTPREMLVALRGSRSGGKYSLPPAIDWLQPATSGEYRLKNTGEVVLDPDYTASFRITAPQKH